MKKLSLLVVAALITLAANAQNTANITQGGVSNTATAAQGSDIPGFAGSSAQGANNLTSTITQVANNTANNTNNTAMTFQVGADHNAYIQQNGRATNNRAAITQMNTAGTTGGNSATIGQHGSGGDGMQSGERTDVLNGLTSGKGNWAGVWQNGADNRGVIRQGGSTSEGNFAETWQQGTNNRALTLQRFGETNLAEIYQGVQTRPRGAPYGIADVFVKNNRAGVDQRRGESNVAELSQISNNNQAYISQNGGDVEDEETPMLFSISSNFEPSTGYSISNTAVVTQGDGVGLISSGDNSANVVQNSNSENNFATTLQTGKSNYADIYQRGNGFGGGSSEDNKAYITQTGDRNEADIDQITYAGVSSFNSATITQFASARQNGALIVQGSEFNDDNHNVALIQQRGKESYGSIYQQNGSSHNDATIRQGRNAVNDEAYINQSNSTSATASITQNQTATAPNGDSDNYAEIYQTGQRNIGHIRQEGSANTAGLVQSGDAAGRNRARFNQTGNGNIIGGSGSIPFGDLNGSSGYASQDGRRNDMDVDQISTGSLTYANTAMLDQLGRRNGLIVNQLTDGTAMGSNMSTVSQNGNDNRATVFQYNGTALP